jgi:hypothetical protein
LGRRSNAALPTNSEGESWQQGSPFCLLQIRTAARSIFRVWRLGKRHSDFATAVRAAILVLMPTLEIIGTQSWLISQTGGVAEVERGLSLMVEWVQRSTGLRQPILQKAFTEEFTS